MTLLGQMVRERGITVIIVTHELEIATHASRMIRVRDGRIVWEGNPADAATSMAPPSVASPVPSPVVP
jgi:ABC-type lipoprotein export system ATPase subunit